MDLPIKIDNRTYYIDTNRDVDLQIRNFGLETQQAIRAAVAVELDRREDESELDHSLRVFDKLRNPADRWRAIFAKVVTILDEVREHRNE